MLGTAVASRKAGRFLRNPYRPSMRILVTGGAGFIGSNLVRYLLTETPHEVLNVDKLTYAGNLHSLKDLERHPRYRFCHADICDRDSLDKIFRSFAPEAIMHLAAESHVDRSIDGPAAFISTNIVGTYTLLDACREYLNAASADLRDQFRFLHTGTDEVFGSLEPDSPAFTESTPYAPRSPYAASKASSDHLVRAWGYTYRFPVLITNCSNNYGPYQFPEKLIPTVILKALRGEPIPVYGTGQNVRDWLFVEDHVKALLAVLERGRMGETYAIGGNAEWANLDLVHTICTLLDELVESPAVSRHDSLIQFVEDRPGHDFRYAINARKVRKELGWEPTHEINLGLRKTVAWYLQNREWWAPLLDGDASALSRRGREKSPIRA